MCVAYSIYKYIPVFVGSLTNQMVPDILIPYKRIGIVGRSLSALPASLVPFAAMSDKQYMEEQGIEKALSLALAQVIREKPANALKRIAQLISPEVCLPARKLAIMQTIYLVAILLQLTAVPV